MPIQQTTSSDITVLFYSINKSYSYKQSLLEWGIITRTRQEALQYTDDVHIHPAPPGDRKVIKVTVASLKVTGYNSWPSCKSVGG